MNMLSGLALTTVVAVISFGTACPVPANGADDAAGVQSGAGGGGLKGGSATATPTGSRGCELSPGSAVASCVKTPGVAGRAFGPVCFDTDRTDVKPAFRPLLEEVARWVAISPGAHLLLVGHCDARLSPEYAIAAGERRALSVRRSLVALGVPAGLVQTTSCGAECPEDQGQGEKAWAKNRRVEILAFAP